MSCEASSQLSADNSGDKVYDGNANTSWATKVRAGLHTRCQINTSFICSRQKTLALRHNYRSTHVCVCHFGAAGTVGAAK